MLNRVKSLLPVKIISRSTCQILSSPFHFPISIWKDIKHSKILRLVKLGGLFAFAFFALGYQPILAIPPIKKSVVLAQFTQEQSINAASFSESFQLPHPGYISTYYSKWHPGIDIATGLGMPVHPILKGVVSDVSYGLWGLGHTITIEHEQSLKSVYGHLGRMFVKIGDTVTRDSGLGEVGLTGHTSGPHTHLEVLKDGHYINPQTILPPLPDLAVSYASISASQSASVKNKLN